MGMIGPTEFESMVVRRLDFIARLICTYVSKNDPFHDLYWASKQTYDFEEETKNYIESGQQ